VDTKIQAVYIMNLLVIGSGAREHAIAWRLSSSPQVDRLFMVPGNAGTASIGTNLPASLGDLEGLARLAVAHSIDLTVVGPEVPLANGIVDLFGELGLTIFGPTKAAAQIESSKAFAKELMRAYSVPCPDFRVFHDYHDAYSFLSRHKGPVVVKADGLAAGKGALVCQGKEEALEALYDCMVARAFGTAGDTVVVEEYLEGREVSAFAFSDGEHLSPLVAACDYKRSLDGDAGPNTGGLGSYTPPEFWTPQLADCVRQEIMAPVVRALAEKETPYRGLLYAGLMATRDGPKVLEFNCRFGDPEAQVILPLLKTDLVDVLMASIQGEVDRLSIEWEQGGCVGVVMASGGYPGEYTKGLPISGLQDVDSDVLVFHAGTRLADTLGERQVLTDGGRVLTVVGRGVTLSQARGRVYDNIQRIHFQDAYYRKDIALLRKAVAI